LAATDFLEPNTPHGFLACHGGFTDLLDGHQWTARFQLNNIARLEAHHYLQVRALFNSYPNGIS
jgi:hypothetical protein